LDLANMPGTQTAKSIPVVGSSNIEAHRLALTKVYTFGPTFRAENSNTSLHLAEFWMIEPEIAFADPSDNAALAEGLLKYAFAASIDQ
jgi:asparaginyl-tRNA synthetase